MSVTNANRKITWDGCYNIRDLGGLPINDHAETVYDAFIRADSLAGLTSKGRADLVTAGVNTIIDLREPREAAAASYVFMEPTHRSPPFYINIPMFYIEDRSVLAGLEIPKITTLAEAYCVDLDFHQQTVGQIISTIASVQSGSVVFHCHAGKDRTGIISALLLALAGVSWATIAADYAESESHLQPLYQRWLAEIADPADRERRKMELAACPKTILETLEHLDQAYGGVEAYLLQAGVTGKEISLIRSRLTGQ